MLKSTKGNGNNNMRTKQKKNNTNDKDTLKLPQIKYSDLLTSCGGATNDKRSYIMDDTRRTFLNASKSLKIHTLNFSGNNDEFICNNNSQNNPNPSLKLSITVFCS